MPKYKNEVQSFRHRGFQPIAEDRPDALVPPVVMMFGDGAGPKNFDGSDAPVLWDHWVEEVITVTDFPPPAA